MRISRMPSKSGLRAREIKPTTLPMSPTGVAKLNRAQATKATKAFGNMKGTGARSR